MHMDVEICFWGDGISIKFFGHIGKDIIMFTHQRPKDTLRCVFAGWRQKQKQKEKQKIDIIHNVALHNNIVVEENFLVCLLACLLDKANEMKGQKNEEVGSWKQRILPG